MIRGDLTRDKRARSASRAHRARPLRGGAGDPTLARVRPDGAGRRKGPGPVSVLERFLRRLPVRRFETPEGPLPPDGAAARHIRRVERILVATAAALAVLGFLAYYVPVYRVPDLFPSASVTVPLADGPVTVPWGELSWAIALTTVELLLLTFLNIVGVHEIAVASGVMTAETKPDRIRALLSIGRERKSSEVTRYGIDPFEGLRPWMLFLYNLVFRLKGFLATQVMRYLTRLFLGRYAVRVLLDFAGVPVYMAINAYATHAVLREAKVVLMGPDAIGRLMRRLAERTPSPAERALVYDTLQYIAVSKRDFHQNHYLLTRELLELWRVPAEARHPLPADYLERLRRAPPASRAVCRALILAGFILDGQLSWRERLRLRRLNRLGIVPVRAADVKRRLRAFLSGGGLPLDGLDG